MTSIDLHSSSNHIQISHPAFHLRSSNGSVGLKERALTELSFQSGDQGQAGVVAGHPGRMKEETASESGTWITRRTFLSDDGQVAAIQLKVENRNAEPIHLDTAIPLSVTHAGDLMVDSTGAEAWRVLKLGRFKSDIPTVFRPSVEDVDYRDAAFNAQNVTAGMGVQGDVSENYNMDEIVSEPLTFIKHDGSDTQGLAIGVLGQAHHLTSIAFRFEGEPKQLGSLQVVCEFDERAIDPGASVETHWIVLYTAGTEQQALDMFVDCQKQELNIPDPHPPRSLFCSWYFYGREFLPEDLEENLEELRKDPLPIDTFIIDNGWMDAFGDWNANDKWPEGMAKAADMIAEAGMEPGIWTTPFVMMKHSKQAAEHPELIARDKHGEPATFGYVEGECYVVDVTHPNCEAYFNEVFGRLRSWGFTYHKLDFVRALAVNPDIRFHDPRFNRPMAYRHGLEMIRKAIGPGGYILACGGIYDAANYGVADSIRTGSDSIGSWDHPTGDRAAGTLVQVKQGLLRSYASRLICTDPDCLMLRRREEPFRFHEAEKHNWLSDGKFTDEEAFSLVARQYLSGGSTNITERMAELPDDRRALLHHIIPPTGEPADIVDFQTPNCPTLGLTRVTPKSENIDPWVTLSVSNWENESVTKSVSLGSMYAFSADATYVVFEQFTQQNLGLHSGNATLHMEVPAHGTRVLRIAEWKNRPMIIGTDLHLSGGGVELVDVQTTDSGITGRVETPWKVPVTITALFPDEEGPSPVSTVVNAEGEFTLSRLQPTSAV
jgi:hypothetical protein